MFIGIQVKHVGMFMDYRKHAGNTLLDTLHAWRLSGVLTPPTHAHAQVDLPAAQGSHHGALAALFAEELGLLLEVAPEHEGAVRSAYEAQGLRAEAIGTVSAGRGVSISVSGQPCISGARYTAQTGQNLLEYISHAWDCAVVLSLPRGLRPCRRPTLLCAPSPGAVGMVWYRVRFLYFLYLVL